jgi:hypothetical protein
MPSPNSLLAETAGRPQGLIQPADLTGYLIGRGKVAE